MKSLVHRLIRTMPDEYIFGSPFRYAQKVTIALEESKYKEDFIKSYQEEKIKNILSVARKSSYYKHLSDFNGFSELPVIDKHIMQNDREKFIITKNKADICKTGGSTGTPFSFYINKNRKGLEWYWLVNYSWGKAGFALSDYRAVLRRHLPHGTLYRINDLLKEIQFDNFSLTDSYCDYILDFIEQNKLRFVHAYPSAAFTLCKRIKATNRKTSIKAFLTGGESVLPSQKELIQNELNIRMYSWYGHSEKLILAVENKDCENYHVNPLYGYAELVDKFGHAVSTPGQSGELVGTSFMNTKMSFLRYNTHDIAEFIGHVCPDCGHIGLTFKNIVGRRQDNVIYLKNGTTMSVTSLLLLNNDIFNYIKGIQYYQEKYGELEIRIVPLKNYDSVVKVKISSDILKMFRHQVNIKMVEVESLEYSSNNKLRQLIQAIKA